MAYPMLKGVGVFQLEIRRNMKAAIEYFRLHVWPPVSFVVYLCVEGIVIYSLYRIVTK